MIWAKKIFFFSQIESLEQYIIIDSRNMDVRIAIKMDDGTRKFSEPTQKEDFLVINPISLEILLTDLYNGVKL